MSQSWCFICQLTELFSSPLSESLANEWAKDVISPITIIYLCASRVIMHNLAGRQQASMHLITTTCKHFLQFTQFCQSGTRHNYLAVDTLRNLRSISRNVIPFSAKLFTYFIDGITVPHHNSSANLEITISSNLSFDQHIINIVSKARQSVSILFTGSFSIA